MKNLKINKESGIKAMESIASGDHSLADIKLLTSDKIQDQLKVFLIAQARNELLRVVKLTKFLDQIEENFMVKVNEAALSDDITLKQYGEILTITTALLERSNIIISKVLQDDSLTMILNTTTYTSESEVTQSSVISQLKTPQSRERVRSVIQAILLKADTYAEENHIIDETPTSEESEET